MAGATISCTFGAMPTTLNVTSQAQCLAEGKPVATIKDMAFQTNIPPFGMCSSLANPQVAAATAAALGVLTPQPCTMVPAGTWIPGKMGPIVGKIPSLCNDATLVCAMGAGKISISMPGQTKVTV